jgi:transposase
LISSIPLCTYSPETQAKKRRSLPQPSKPESNPESPPKKEVAPWSANRAAWLLIRDEDDLEDDDRQALGRIKQADEKVAEAYALGQRFVQMVREHQSEALLPWLEDATQSGVEVLKQFAKGIKQDLDAVTNALSLP